MVRVTILPACSSSLRLKPLRSVPPSIVAAEATAGQVARQAAVATVRIAAVANSFEVLIVATD
jgi:hypothetical protein